MMCSLLLLMCIARDIAGAVGKAESLRERMLAWPPVRDAKQRNKPTLADVMSDEMGFLD